MILQLTSLLVNPDIRILDNGSTDPLTVEYLQNVGYPVNYMGNIGPTIWYYIYEDMPSKFVVTDANLLLNENMPSTFLDDLSDISDYYGSYKVGLALRINDYPLMYQYSFHDTCGYDGVEQIWVSQTQYWTQQLENPDGYEVYLSPVDTTFFLFNKDHTNTQDVRVAGNYQLRVLSWYENIDDVYSSGQISRLHRYLAHIDDTPDIFYPIRCFELQYLVDNNIIAASRDIDSVGIFSHLVYLDLESTGADDFWQTVYPTNYNPVFELYDLYLDSAKDYIDIGSWLGDTVFYASRFSSRVIAVEPDSRLVERLYLLFQLSFLESDLILEDSALYSSTETGIDFCVQPNPEADGTVSHLFHPGDCVSPVSVPTISFSGLLSKHSISSVSFINVNINGDEENILQDVYDYSLTNSVPLYVTFYHSRWVDPDLTRFTFLTTGQRSTITAGVTSLLFNAPV